MSPLRINMFSGPRNLSTAMMYAFAQRPDTKVFDEPYYGYYLRQTGINHPGKEETMKVMPTTERAVLEEIIFSQSDHPIHFYKQMTQHLVEVSLEFTQESKNFLLIRRPDAVIQSFSKVITRPTIEDLGIQKERELYDYLVKHDLLHAIIDADEVKKDPDKILQQLCWQLNITFHEEMLQWPVGPRPEDGPWAKYWYHSLHQSTGFQPYQPEKIELTGYYRELEEACHPHYDQLYKQALKA